MLKCWRIYKNDFNIGQADKMNLAFRSINALIPKDIPKYWQSADGYIKLVIEKDIYEAKKEEMH